MAGSKNMENLSILSYPVLDCIVAIEAVVSLEECINAFNPEIFQ